MASAPNDSLGSAPLLPTEELPDVVKKEPVAVSKPVQPPTQTSTEPESPVKTEQQTLPDQVGLEEPGTNKAVDEIVAAESDELLERQDSRAAKAAPAAAPERAIAAAFPQVYQFPLSS